MRPILQDKFYSKELGTRGNCQQAATASILGLALEQVPNFLDAEFFWAAYHAFLKSKGFIDIELPPNSVPDCFYLAYGQSSRGVKHACIYRAGALVHDPHPSGEGIVKVDEIHIIVPIEISLQS